MVMYLSAKDILFFTSTSIYISIPERKYISIFNVLKCQV